MKRVISLEIFVEVKLVNDKIIEIFVEVKLVNNKIIFKYRYSFNDFKKI